MVWLRLKDGTHWIEALALAMTDLADSVCPMNTALAIGFATTGATLLLTIGLFILDRVLARRRERQEVRRSLVTRVLDTFDASTRRLLRPAFVQAWSNSEVEYALLTPRLLLDLNGRDRLIVPWLQRQIQHMQLSISKKDRMAVRAMVMDRLLQWQAGRIKPNWFGQQLAIDPVQKDFSIPGTIKLKQYGRDSWAWVELFGFLAGVSVLIRQAVTR